MNRYHSVPGSQYTLVNAPQRQCFTDDNLAFHVMMVINTLSKIFTLEVTLCQQLTEAWNISL